jgi:hypothetical protein
MISSLLLKVLLSYPEMENREGRTNGVVMADRSQGTMKEEESVGA